MRAFVAVELPEEVRARVAAASRALLDGLHVANPVPAENLHVTVRFVGEVAQSSVGSLCAAVGDAAATVTPSVANARGFGVFPDRRRPSVVWTGIEDPAGVFARLEGAVSERLSTLGVAREQRPYSPHVTVARIRDRLRNPELLSARLAAADREPPDFGAIPVGCLTVFQSEPGRGGPRYAALARCPLNHP